MNQKEWKEFCKTNRKEGYYWYNKVKKILLSKEFEFDERTDLNADIIHHLRDTEEQRKYNDEHYEMFGYVIDENGNEQFNYGDYVVFWTQDHHRKYHHVSEETRKKLSESLKGIPRTDAWRQHASESNKGRLITEEQRLQISKSVKEYYEQEGSREKTSRSTKEAMHRPEVRQHLIEGCKKRLPISKEARQRAAEANKARPMSEQEIANLYNYFNSIVGERPSLNIKDLSKLYRAYNYSNISWNTFQKAFREFKSTLD